MNPHTRIYELEHENVRLRAKLAAMREYVLMLERSDRELAKGDGFRHRDRVLDGESQEIHFASFDRRAA